MASEINPVSVSSSSNLAASASPKRGDGPSAESTAKEFEAVFLGQVAQLMLESVDTGEFSGGHAETMMRSIMASEIGRDMADRGGVGLAPAVLEQIILLQGGTHQGDKK